VEAFVVGRKFRSTPESFGKGYQSVQKSGGEGGRYACKGGLRVAGGVGRKREKEDVRVNLSDLLKWKLKREVYFIEERARHSLLERG